MSEVTPNVQPASAGASKVISFNPGVLMTDVKGFVTHPSLLLLEKLIMYVVGVFGVVNPTGGIPSNVRDWMLAGAAFVVGTINHKPTTVN